VKHVQSMEAEARRSPGGSIREADLDCKPPKPAIR